MDLFPQVELSEIDFKKWKVYVPNSEMDLFPQFELSEIGFQRDFPQSEGLKNLFGADTNSTYDD